jgi:SAM-dependent methyltransferase
MENINNTYFDGYYKDIWRDIIPAELTQKEAEFMETYFGLDTNSSVIDLMCGYGRHALALGRKGIRVTAVDNLADYIDDVKKAAAAENLPVTALQADIAHFVYDGQADLAICMGNSLNFFSAEEALPILKNTAAALRPGGQLLINTWSLAEIAIKQFTARTWAHAAGMRYISECRYEFFPSRIEAEHLIIAPDGTTEIKKGVDYIFSVGEMDQLLRDAGFEIEEIYSIPGRKKFALGEPRAYIVARKK